MGQNDFVRQEMRIPAINNSGRWRMVLCALVMAVSSAACAQPRLPEFPIGMYGVEDSRQIGRLREAGFDCFQSYSESSGTLHALARGARKAGMRILAHPHGLIAAGSAPKDWPLAAWYLQDEPDVTRTPPTELESLDEKVRRWSPGVPTAFVVGQGSAVARYAGAGDVVMVDWYPVPHLPLESVGEQVGLAVAGARGKPVWAVLQAMDWRGYPQRNATKARIGRFPNQTELRFMSYDAVFAGARGLWYFTDTMPGGKPLGDRPELWSSVAAVAREMRAMSSVFARGRPIPLPFEPPASALAARSWTYRGRDYLVLINRAKGVSVKVPAAALEKSWRPLFATRRDPRDLLREYNGAYYLNPYQVMVLESRLRPKRLLGR